MKPETVDYLVSRSIILVLCGVLAGFLLTGNLDTFQQINVAASCVTGVIAFLTVDGGLKSRNFQRARRLRTTEELLHRRIDMHVAILKRRPRRSEMLQDLPHLEKLYQTEGDRPRYDLADI